MADETISGNGEPDTQEAEALAAALNHSAERVQTLWFSFLTFMLYLAVAIGTTTHRTLFLESPLKLPVLNIDLPLLGFYILTPIIFVVFHFYMLLNLVLLARTAKSFEDSLMRALPEDGEARETFRMRIENTLFVQLLVGGKLEREGLNAKLLSLMAMITLALAPVALLLMFEIKFLPYHSEWITWLHRGLLALDLPLVWTLWPGYRSGWGVRLCPQATWWLAVPGAFSAAAVAYAVIVATFPDEHMYLATNWLRGKSEWERTGPKWEFHDRAVWNGLIAPVKTLDLHGEDLIDDAKLAHLIEKNESSTDAHRWVATLSLKKRDLTCANLDRADVRHVDFSHAILNRAYLDNAWARRAHFDDNAQLQGASLDHAQLQGASLDYAQLQGASLVRAQLHGAELAWARLQGADFSHAQLQGASLESAQLQGASLDDAQLQGATLEFAQLQGASLDYAQLQGASLVRAQLQGASFRYAFVWRADAREAIWKDTRVAGPETRPKGTCLDELTACDWTAASLKDLKRLIADQFPTGYNQQALEGIRIKQNLDPNKALEGEDEMAKIWATREHETPAREVYESSVAEIWRELGCAAEGAPHVIRGLVNQLGEYTIGRNGVVYRSYIPRIPIQSDAAKVLAKDFLDEAHCPGAHGLSEADKAELKKIAAPAAP